MHWLSFGLALLYGIAGGFVSVGISGWLIDSKAIQYGIDCEREISPCMRVVALALHVCACGVAGALVGGAALARLCLLASAAAVGAIVDLKIRIIPNSLVAFVLLAGLGERLVTPSGFAVLTLSLVALAVADICATRGIGARGIGGGDIKMLLACIAVVGSSGITAFAVALAVALFAVCAAKLARGEGMQSTFAMCPALMVALAAGVVAPLL